MGTHTGQTNLCSVHYPDLSLMQEAFPSIFDTILKAPKYPFFHIKMISFTKPSILSVFLVKELSILQDFFVCFQDGQR
jgi:hypothetical protein